MSTPRFLSGSLALGLAGCLAWTQAAAQDAPAIDFYASLRTQVEAVRPDRDARLDSYAGVRDAYSRVGIKIDHPLGAELALTGQLELPVDSANFRMRDPYDQGDAQRPHGERIRLAHLGLRSRFGTITWGQQWMPYYNAVAAPVDMFSTYYSGFATYTVFRVAQTLSYSTPEVAGFSLSAGYTGSSGNARSTSRIDARRRQIAATYTFGDTRLAAGIDDRGDAGYGRNRLYGLSLSHQAGKLYLAAKFERFDSGNRQPGSFSSDGNKAINLFGSYAMAKTAVKLMLARVENYGDNIVHVGVDHQLRDDLKFFAEYYREGTTAVLTPRRGGLDDFDADISGGHAIAVGIRYDF
ncbi:porin [Massilia sp. LC238]|uniref:porin n=1 Tax=Massilia sp. LC238 TaxID=1502852 RepID=UPI0004E3BDBE|nr:porin [Massilia sp. LC238]KFC73528.1 Outer membrane protein (porin) [Massilia sp. LC238]